MYKPFPLSGFFGSHLIPTLEKEVVPFGLTLMKKIKKISNQAKILEPASKQSPEVGDKHHNAQLGYNQSRTEVITLNTDTNTVWDESLTTANITEKVEEDAPPSSSSWDDVYQQLLDHKKTYGNLTIPIFDVNNPELGTWVTNRKSDYLKIHENKQEGRKP
jgi:hypothetical protein